MVIEFLKLEELKEDFETEKEYLFYFKIKENLKFIFHLKDILFHVGYDNVLIELKFKNLDFNFIHEVDRNILYIDDSLLVREIIDNVERELFDKILNLKGEKQ